MSDPDLFDSALNPETVTRFANFLKADTNALELAQQVIPALREEEGSAHSRYQQHVLRHLETQRTTYALRQTWTQDAFDTKAYTKEKETFQGAELHRARLFVQRNEHLSSDEKQDVVKWLEQCPLAMRRAAQKSREVSKDRKFRTKPFPTRVFFCSSTHDGIFFDAADDRNRTVRMFMAGRRSSATILKQCLLLLRMAL